MISLYARFHCKKYLDLALLYLISICTLLWLNCIYYDYFRWFGIISQLEFIPPLFRLSKLAGNLVLEKTFFFNLFILIGGKFQLVLRVLWTARKSNQSILKEISPEYSLEGLMLKQKLQSFGHLMWRTDSLEKTLMLGNTEGRRRRGQQMVGWHPRLNGHEFEQAKEVGDGQGCLACCSPWGCKELDTTEWLNWTELKLAEYD